MEVSSGEDNVSKTDALTYKREAPDDDDVEDRGAYSAELIFPNSISSDASEQAHPFIDDWAASIVPPARGCGRKCPVTSIRRNQPLPLADQVMSQIKFPPYRGPRSPLDLIVVEIIFRRPFEAF
jgi:hypothetical protein